MMGKSHPPPPADKGIVKRHVPRSPFQWKAPHHALSPVIEFRRELRSCNRRVRSRRPASLVRTVGGAIKPPPIEKRRIVDRPAHAVARTRGLQDQPEFAGAIESNVCP